MLHVHLCVCNYIGSRLLICLHFCLSLLSCPYDEPSALTSEYSNIGEIFLLYEAYH